MTRDEYVRDAFSLLAHETRLEILEYLRDAQEPASYAEIKDGIGVRDSGRFNYHLSELTGTFVTESDEGYELSFSANRLYQTVLSTRPLSEHPTPELETGHPCPECGSTFEVRYDWAFLVSQCPACGAESFGYPFPAGGFDDRTDEEALRAAVQLMYHHISLAKRGVCPYCSGVMTSTWTSDHGTCLYSTVLVRHSCSLCGMTLHSGVFATIMHDATVVSLFDEYGMDPRTMLPWEWRTCASPTDVSVRAEDPFRVTLPVEIRGDEYVFHVLETTNGVDVEIEPVAEKIG